MHGNEQVIRWLRAAAFLVVTGVALHRLAFDPAGVAWTIAVVVGLTALFSPYVAVALSVVAMSLPLLAANLLAGALFLIVGLATSQYLGQQNGRVFLLVATAFVGAVYGPAWLAVIVAGYLLGASEGAIAAMIACFALEAAGIVLGREYLGVVFAGGASPAPLALTDVPAGLLRFGWVTTAVESIETAPLIWAFRQVPVKVMLLLQPAIWAGAAAISGMLARPTRGQRSLKSSLLGAVAATVVLVAATAVAGTLAGRTTSLAGLSSTAFSSLLVAALFIVAWEKLVAGAIPSPAPSRATRPGSMAAEDADVDELLRLIATAEDELAAKHSARAAVMITDMKSFSKMTEEDGSVISAKAIQRHRDLLLPVISVHGGNGKSTGGDGLIASFERPSDALGAAVDMQRSLLEYNALHEGERDIVIRCGIAFGDVLLDKGGRPFIGAALNLSARVMNLADGGQIMVTADIAEHGAASGIRTHSHGSYRLKNIAEPVEVVEVLWSPDQEPREPQNVVT